MVGLFRMTKVGCLVVLVGDSVTVNLDDCLATDNEELGIIDEVTFTMGIVVAKAIPVFVVATVTVFVVVRMMLPGLVVLIDRLTLLRVAFCLLVLINYFGRGLCPSMTVMFAVV